MRFGIFDFKLIKLIKKHKIKTISINGTLRGISDDLIKWARKNNLGKNKNYNQQKYTWSVNRLMNKYLDKCIGVDIATIRYRGVGSTPMYMLTLTYKG